MGRGGLINWWRRPCGGREVLALALPLIISTGSWSVMNFFDRMFLLWNWKAEMAAAMPAGAVYFSMVCLPWGIALYVNTFVAQYDGAKRPERIGLAVWQGVRVGVYTTPLFLLAIPLAPTLFAAFDHESDMIALEVIYFQVLCFGAPGMVIATAMSTFFSGRGKTRVVMVVDVAASALNVVLDYAWIFGHWHFPAMGIEGAAWATVVSQWFRVAAYWWLMMRPVYREKYGLVAGRRFDAPLMRRLLRFGGPNGLQMLVEISAFSLFLLFVGNLGQDAMVATNLAFNINNVAFVPMFGMGIALTTLVGQQLGRDDPRMAGRATWTTLWIAMAFFGTMATLYVVVPDWFLWGHALGTSADDFQRLRDVTVVLLRFVAAYCLFDALNLTFVSAIKGAGDTRFILITVCVTSPPPVLATWIGIEFFSLGLMWCWIVVTAWVCSLGIIYMARFLQGRWKTMRVIEPDLMAELAPSEDDEQPADQPVALTT